MVSPEEITAKLAEKGIVEEAVSSKMEHSEPESIAEDAIVAEVLPEAAEDAPKFSEIESEAMKKGWKPDGPKSADEFLRAEPLYEEIKQRGKEIKTLRSQVDELMKHVGNLKKVGYQNQLDNIKQERANAVARSDLASVDYLDEQLQQVRTELQKETPPPMHPAAVAFVEKYNDLINDYSLESQEIKEFIDFRDRQLAAHHLDPELHMKTLEKDLQRRYPEKFVAPERAAPVRAVESDSRPMSTRSKAKYSFADLDPVQKSVYKKLDKQFKNGGQDYIKQLIDLNQLQ